MTTLFCRWCLVAAAFFSTLATAQDTDPSLMPFPLEVKRVPPGFTKKEIDDLTLELPRLLRVAKLSVPTSAVSEKALAALKRQDCDRDDGCLQQLAQKAETLYAIYASVDFTLDKNVVAAGRVVSDEGTLIRRLKTVTLPKGKALFATVAREALSQLVSELELTKLPTARMVAPVAETRVAEGPEVAAPVAHSPPPTPPLVEAATEPKKIAGYATAGAGIAAIIAGGMVYLTAPPIRFNGTNVVADDAPKVVQAQTQQRVGSALIGVGLAACVVGGILWGTAPSGRPAVAVVPIVGGGAVTVGGTFQ